MTFELNSPREEKGNEKGIPEKMNRVGKGPLVREITVPSEPQIRCLYGWVCTGKWWNPEPGRWTGASSHLVNIFDRPCAQLGMGHNDKRGAGNIRVFGHTICLIRPWILSGHPSAGNMAGTQETSVI